MKTRKHTNKSETEGHGVRESSVVVTNMFIVVILSCVAVIVLFYFLGTIKEEAMLALDSQEVIDKRLSDRFFMLWIGSHLLASWVQIALLHGHKEWRWLMACFAMAKLSVFALFVKEKISRQLATITIVTAMSCLNLTRSYISNSRLAMHPQWVFYYLFGILVSEKPILIVLIFMVTQVV